MKHFKILSKYATCLILSLCFLLMGTFNIYADYNYKDYISNACVQFGTNGPSYYVFKATTNARFVKLNGTLWLISDDANIKYSFVSMNYNFPNCSSNPSLSPSYTTTINGITYKGSQFSNPFNGYYSNEIPNISDTSNFNNAIYYTYGDGQGTAPIQWGTLKDIGFSTSLATNGTVNVGLNRDKIYWNGLTDTLDNELTDNQKVEIHAIGNFYRGSSLEDLYSLMIVDLNYPVNSDYNMGYFNANKGYTEISWQAVANGLNMNLDKITPHQDNSDWYKYGWIYKVRLTDPTTGYIGNWQTLYTITSMPPEQTQNIYNTSFLNENIINVVNEVNNINSETNENNYVTENYEINNTVINYPENPDGNKIIDDSIEQEDEYITQLDTQLTDIDISPLDLLGIQGIQKAFEWIRAVHLRTVEQTTLGTVTGIIMLIGLAVYLIGRRRG